VKPAKGSIVDSRSRTGGEACAVESVRRVLFNTDTWLQIPYWVIPEDRIVQM